MEENPFAGLVDLMKDTAKGEIPVFFQIGKIVSTAPVKIMLGEIPIEAEELAWNESLLKIEMNDVTLSDTSGSLSGSYNCTNCSGSRFSVSSGSLRVNSLQGNLSLSVGDNVILLPYGERFIVFCKVVGL
jgi:hypothetical protein